MPEVTILRDRYRLERLLGRGGMADVFLAFDTRRQVYIAVKLLREDLAEDPEFVKRFQREAEALARLDHPYIVRFYSFERQGALAFIVMDFVPGTTLRGRLMEAGGPLPLAEVTKVLRQIGSALQYAHNEGFIHRDIKPGNIMLREDGAALLSDFGIARATEASTMTLGPLGTPAYMSPEQILGREADARTDVYCLGVVLYEMVTGRRPFLGETGTGTSTTERVRYEHLHVPPTDPRVFNRALPPQAVATILRAMAKDPGQRWPDVMSLVQDWEAALGLEHESPTGREEATVVRGTVPRTMPVTPGSRRVPPEPLLVRTPTGPRQSDDLPPPPVVRRKRPGWVLWGSVAGLIALGGAALVCTALVVLPALTGTPTPTLGAVATVAVSDTAEIEMLPTATEPAGGQPTPVDDVGERSGDSTFRILSDTAWVADNGSISIVGEVTNVSNQSIGKMVTVRAILSDSGGNVIPGDYYAYLDRPVIPPGEKSSFWVLIPADDLQADASAVAEYELQFWITNGDSPDIEMRVDSAEAVTENGYLYIRGRATNDTDREFVGITVYSTIYDAAGEVVNATLDRVSLDTPLRPGQSTAFEGYFIDHHEAADSFYVFVTGWTRDNWTGSN